MKASIKKHICIGIILLFFSLPMFAQIPFPIPGFEEGPDDSSPAAPIDGFISIILAAGAFYGISKIHKNK